jgi:predicted transcriptional regulator
MPKRVISNVELEKLVREGNNVSTIAKKLGVTKGAVSKRLKALKVAISKDVTLRSIPEVVDKKINSIQQLQKINRDANEILELLMRWSRGEDEAIQILETQMRKVRVGKTEKFIEKFKFKDPRELALKAMQEIRGQLNLQLEIFKTLYDLKAIEEFQKEVLAAIGEAAPDVRDKIIHNLQEAKAVRSTLELH